MLDRIDGGYRASLDGNEQYDDVDGVVELWERDARRAAPAPACATSVAFIEQPIKRQAALARDVAALSAQKPVIIDESDDSLDAFVRARAARLPRRLVEDLQGPLQVAHQPRPLRAMEPRTARRRRPAGAPTS